VQSVETILTLLGLTTALAFVAHKAKVPYPILLVVGGMGLAFVPGLPTVSLDPQLVFLFFLPPILYAAGYFTSWRDFRSNIVSITLLAVGLVVATTLAVAAVVVALVRGAVPGIVWIDDVHLADASTLEFLGYLARRLDNHPLALMVTWRLRSRREMLRGPLAGLAVAREAGVDLNAAAAALETLTAGDKRGEVFAAKGATILNDSYNSNPEALRSMIRTLAARPAKRRILIAGEMLEMGEQGPALHSACGRAAADAGLDLVVGVGGNAEHLAAAACAGGVAALFLPDAEAAGRWLKQNLRKGDVALIKGSRGVHLERAIEVLKSRAIA